MTLTIPNGVVWAVYAVVFIVGLPISILVIILAWDEFKKSRRKEK